MEGYHIVRLTYQGEISGEPILDEENEKYQWLTVKEMKAIPEEELDIYLREILEQGLLDIS